MLFYLYHFDYSDAVNEQEAFTPIVFDVYMHSIADKYNIDDLEKLAASKFSTRAREEWKTQAFADAIQLIFTQAADRQQELRKTVLDVCSKHAKKLHSKEYGAAFRAVALSVPEFGGELSGRLSQSREQVTVGKTYRCPSCSQTFSMKVTGNSNYHCPYCHNGWQGNQWRGYEAEHE